VEQREDERHWSGKGADEELDALLLGCDKRLRYSGLVQDSGGKTLQNVVVGAVMRIGLGDNSLSGQDCCATRRSTVCLIAASKSISRPGE